MIKKIAYRDKAEWIELRKKMGIGGSDAGAVLGMNPYKSAYTLWAEKTGRIPEFEGNLTTEVGSYLEEFVARLFVNETGKKVRRENKMLVNTDYDFAFGDVDRVLVGENAVLEIKTTNSLPAMRKFKNGEYPEQWYCQAVHYMAVGGYDRAYIAVLINCREFKTFTIERDEAEIEALMNQEKSFWELVKTQTPPMADGSDSTSETLTTIYPDSNGNAVSLMAYEEDLKQYMTFSSLMDDIKKQREEIANRIKSFMGEAGRGESNKFKVTWSSSIRSTFDHKRFAQEHPQMNLTDYYKSTPTRTFKINER